MTKAMQQAKVHVDGGGAASGAAGAATGGGAAAASPSPTRKSTGVEFALSVADGLHHELRMRRSLERQVRTWRGISGEFKACRLNDPNNDGSTSNRAAMADMFSTLGKQVEALRKEQLSQSTTSAPAEDTGKQPGSKNTGKRAESQAEATLRKEFMALEQRNGEWQRRMEAKMDLVMAALAIGSNKADQERNIAQEAAVAPAAVAAAVRHGSVAVTEQSNDKVVKLEQEQDAHMTNDTQVVQDQTPAFATSEHTQAASTPASRRRSSEVYWASAKGME
jgi:hypothetical protein